MPSASVTAPYYSSYRTANETARDWQLCIVLCCTSDTQKTGKCRWEKILVVHFFSDCCLGQSRVRAWMIPAKEEKSWFKCTFLQCQQAHRLGGPTALLVNPVLKIFVSVSLLSAKCYNKLPCSRSDRLFGGFLTTCQHVILLTPFKNLSSVGISFPACWIFLHTPVVN